jgi:regulator of protease activity HflC (stomatin/prohibitin superfamily)
MGKRKAKRAKAKKAKAKKTSKAKRAKAKKSKTKAKKKASAKKVKSKKKASIKKAKKVKAKSRKAKRVKKVARSPRVKPAQTMFEPLEQVTVNCSNCGRGFNIVKLHGLSTEGMICQRCAVGEIEFPE